MVKFAPNVVREIPERGVAMKDSSRVRVYAAATAADVGDTPAGVLKPPPASRQQKDAAVSQIEAMMAQARIQGTKFTADFIELRNLIALRALDEIRSSTARILDECMRDVKFARAIDANIAARNLRAQLKGYAIFCTDDVTVTTSTPKVEFQRILVLHYSGSYAMVCEGTTRIINECKS